MLALASMEMTVHTSIISSWNNFQSTCNYISVGRFNNHEQPFRQIIKLFKP